MYPSLSPQGGRTNRAISSAGYLAYLYGVVGMVTGLLAALTFIPYRTASTYASGYADLFTAIAVLGTAASAAGIVSAWGLFRYRPWSWSLALTVAGSCIALNALLAGLWPGYGGFLGLITIAYGVEVLLLLVGRTDRRRSAESGITDPHSSGPLSPATGGHP